MEKLNQQMSRVKGATEEGTGNREFGGGNEKGRNFSILECKSVQELKKIGNNLKEEL